ncbi:HAUS augmin-like complex subunit 5 isoform X2 [Grus americana]|uniref:HAUS augmin-like complex subunit 5 isoform X2 n=1 Tax=Grus americana TaxID=9117 RepID=UPI002407EA5A|nr:HAUS augmin-like complex subunit 5 isoform X2 [Grus americana]
MAAEAALGRWARTEMELPPGIDLSGTVLRRLCSGPCAPIWEFVTRHVRHPRNVKKIRGNLLWYRHLEMEGAGLAQAKEEARGAVSRLRQEVGGAAGGAPGRAREAVLELEAALEAELSRRGAELRRGLELRLMGAEATREGRRLREGRGNLRPPHRPGEAGPQLAAAIAMGMEPEVLASVRAVCRTRAEALESLLEPRPSLEAQELMEAATKRWLREAEAVLSRHPPGAVLWALEHLALDSARRPRPPPADCDLDADAGLDPAPEAEAPPTVRRLLQAGAGGGRVEGCPGGAGSGDAAASGGQGSPKTWFGGAEDPAAAWETAAAPSPAAAPSSGRGHQDPQIPTAAAAGAGAGGGASGAGRGLAGTGGGKRAAAAATGNTGRTGRAGTAPPEAPPRSAAARLQGAGAANLPGPAGGAVPGGVAAPGAAAGGGASGVGVACRATPPAGGSCGRGRAGAVAPPPPGRRPHPAPDRGLAPPPGSRQPMVGAAGAVDPGPAPGRRPLLPLAAALDPGRPGLGLSPPPPFGPAHRRTGKAGPARAPPLKRHRPPPLAEIPPAGIKCWRGVGVAVVGAWPRWGAWPGWGLGSAIRRRRQRRRRQQPVIT